MPNINDKLFNKSKLNLHSKSKVLIGNKLTVYDKHFIKHKVSFSENLTNMSNQSERYTETHPQINLRRIPNQYLKVLHPDIASDFEDLDSLPYTEDEEYSDNINYYVDDEELRNGYIPCHEIPPQAFVPSEYYYKRMNIPTIKPKVIYASYQYPVDYEVHPRRIKEIPTFYHESNMQPVYRMRHIYPCATRAPIRKKYIYDNCDTVMKRPGYYYTNSPTETKMYAKTKSDEYPVYNKYTRIPHSPEFLQDQVYNYHPIQNDVRYYETGNHYTPVYDGEEFNLDNNYLENVKDRRLLNDDELETDSNLQKPGNINRPTKYYDYQQESTNISPKQLNQEKHYPKVSDLEFGRNKYLNREKENMKNNIWIENENILNVNNCQPVQKSNVSTSHLDLELNSNSAKLYSKSTKNKEHRDLTDLSNYPFLSNISHTINNTENTKDQEKLSKNAEDVVFKNKTIRHRMTPPEIQNKVIKKIESYINNFNSKSLPKISS